MRVFAFLLLALFPMETVLANEIDAEGMIRDLGQVREEIQEAESDLGRHDGGVIKAIIQERLEILRLTEALLEQRALAAQTGVPVDFSLSASEPNARRADDLLAEIANVRDDRDRLRGEVRNYAGSLAQSLAFLTLATKQQTLAILEQGYLIAKYGLPVPSASYDNAPDAVQKDSDLSSAQSTLEAESGRAESADPSGPNLDYDRKNSRAADVGGKKIHANWEVMVDRAEIDDSPRVRAVNQTVGRHEFGTDPAFMTLACEEGVTSIFFDFDYSLYGDAGGISVQYRIDERDHVTTHWAVSINNRLTGVVDEAAVALIKDLQDARKIFVRVTGGDGDRAFGTWDLDGIRDATIYAADACGWTL